MANASQLFKDDEQERLGNGYTPDDSSLRNMTGISKNEESGYDNSARSGAAEDIANREKSSVSDNGNQAGGEKFKNAAGLASAEALGGGLAAMNPAFGALKGGKILSALWGSKKRKRNTIGGGITGLLVAGVMFFLGIASGPLQLIHLAEILGKSFVHSENSTSLRTNSLFRYAKSGDYGQTRLTYLGSKIFGGTVDELKGIGIDMGNTGGSYLKNVTVDTAELSKKYPELNDKSMATKEAKIKFLADKLGIPEADLSQVRDGKFAVNTRNYGVKTTRLLLKNSTALLDDGKIASAIKFRQLAKFYDVPSMFHPMKRLTAAAEKKLTTLAERKIAENERQAANEKPVRDKISSLKSALDEKLGGIKGKLGGALFVTGTTCLIKGSVNEIVTFDHAAVIAPSVVKAMGAISLGSQIKKGQDVSSGQVGAVVESLQDSYGKSIWQGESLQVLASNSQVGTDLPPTYKPLYSNSTTANKISSALDSPALNAMCSGPGLAAQFIGGVILISLAPETGGATGAVIAGAKFVGTTVAVGIVVKGVVGLVETSDVVPKVLSGPLGGNIFAYGARAAAGVEARSSGGIELTSAQTAVLDKQSQIQDQNNFKSKSLFAKMFDIKDYRSLSGKLADSISPNLQTNVASLLGGITHLGSLITHVFASIMPRASAASTPYDWGTPEYGIPPEVLSSTNYADPYANAAAVATVLNKNDEVTKSYIKDAKSCFGVNIINTASQDQPPVWDVSSVGEVYPTDQSYTDANCNRSGDSNWTKIMLFVFDTKTMKAAACYSGDNQSCTELGQNI